MAFDLASSVLVMVTDNWPLALSSKGVNVIEDLSIVTRFKGLDSSWGSGVVDEMLGLFIGLTGK